MNGRDFLDSAQRLSNSSYPADLRSSVSRSYYGAFHVALQFFNDCGIRFSRHNTGTHKKLPQCLENSQVPPAQAIRRKLSSLRSDRRLADYDLQDLRMENAMNVQLRLQSAWQIAQEINAIVADSVVSDNLRSILQARARSLGLQVV